VAGRAPLALGRAPLTGSWLVRLSRRWALLIVLAVTAVVLPEPTPGTGITLVRVGSASGVDSDRIVWVLALGSDARLGEPPLRSRADAIQLLALDLRDGHGAVIGIPRDSWVAIPGHGAGRVNSALELGGPRLMAGTVAGMTGVSPDYVVTTTFVGFKRMVGRIGGVTVHSRSAFTDDAMVGSITRGRNRVGPHEALFFSRARHYLPQGDFDRSANQQELLRGILRQVRARAEEPGFMERTAFVALRNLETDLPPAELYRLAHAAVNVRPERLGGCVLDGSYGTVNGASIVFADLDQARRLAADARRDADFDGGC